MRATSLSVYNNIRDNGLLSKLRFEVYNNIFKHGPITCAEYVDLYATDGRRINSYSGRFTELEELDVIREVVVKRCSVTGNLASAFDVTENVPKNIPRKKTKKELKTDIVKNINACLLLNDCIPQFESQILKGMINDL